MRARPSTLPVVLICASAACVSGLHAQCSSLKNPGSQLYATQVNIRAGSDGAATLIDGAIRMWSSGCQDAMGQDFPNLLNGGSGGIVVTVTQGSHNSADRECGRFQSNQIVLYTTATYNGRRIDCGNQTMNLAHEIGHLLGLTDAPESASCQNHIMAWLNNNNLQTRAVREEECGKVDARWQMPTEPTGGDQGGLQPRPCI